ncbi:MAG: hypothetical protein ACI9OJ_002984 [Myxococcota bacterium]|jgi:hypothetical protein
MSAVGWTVRNGIVPVLIAGLATLLMAGPANAHLMVSQRGTLKLGKGGYFFVVSIPVSAFEGIDDSGDGRLSPKELRTHDATMKTAVRSGLVLDTGVDGPCVVEGLLLNLGHGHGRARTRATHVVAMGRFNVVDSDAPLTLKMTLFGKKKREQAFEITLTRGKTKQVAILTPAAPTHALFTTK